MGADDPDLVTIPFALPFTDNEPDSRAGQGHAPVLAAAAVPYGQALPPSFRREDLSVPSRPSGKR
jgi:hypothetical protein